MGLFTTYSKANQIVTAHLVTTISCDVKAYTNTFTPSESGSVSFSAKASVIEYTRNRSMQFKYVGMTEAAAKTCADAMRTKFTRNKRVWTQQVSGSGATYSYYYKLEPITKENLVSTATVNSVYVGGHMWEVNIDVSESLPFYSGQAEPEIANPAYFADHTVFVDGTGVGTPWTYELT